MDDICSFNWQPIDALPLFSATIEVISEETEQQYKYIAYLQEKTYQLENKLITKIINFYQSQLNKILFYEAQLQRWINNCDKSKKKHQSILKLINKIGEAKRFSHSIIQIASEIQAMNRQQVCPSSNKKIFFDFINGKIQEKN
jgi:hypothetical protein